jgi:acetylornithine aminotransferase
VRPLADDYLRGVRALCDERGALLVADEVQSGLGRCGDWAALQHAGVEADVLTLAKALGGGLPIGAMLARAELSFTPGDHASTFGGGPVVCAGALAVLDTIERDGLLERAREIGEALPGAAVAAAPDGAVVESRGRGCLWGFQLARPVANDVVLAMIDEGVLATPAGPDVVRMSPPLTSSDEDVAEAARAFGAAVATGLAPAEEGSA